MTEEAIFPKAGASEWVSTYARLPGVGTFLSRVALFLAHPPLSSTIVWSSHQGLCLNWLPFFREKSCAKLPSLNTMRDLSPTYPAHLSSSERETRWEREWAVYPTWAMHLGPVSSSTHFLLSIRNDSQKEMALLPHWLPCQYSGQINHEGSKLEEPARAPKLTSQRSKCLQANREAS